MDHNNHNSKRDSNPDRPPVTPEHPDSPDPFDPFKTTPIADGGAIVQPTAEIQFQKHLDDALQPQTPQAPQGPQGPTVSQPAQKETPPSQEEPYENSLIQVIDELRETITPGWQYHVHELDTETTLEHAVTNPDNDTQYTLRRIDSAYFVYPGSERPGNVESPDNPNGYGSFEIALGALVEGIDWGTLPINPPNIWTYTGYHDNNQTFPQYLSGRNNTECGDHYFANHSADYGVSIESYQNPNQPETTVSVLSITNDAERGRGDTVYREQFNGQNQAFSVFLGFLDSELSHSVYSHDDHTGPVNAIQSVDELIR